MRLRPGLRLPVALFALAVLSLSSACSTRATAPLAAAPPPAAAEREEPAEAPAAVEPIAPVARDILGDVPYDLPVEANRWVESELDFLVGKRHEVIASWLKRGSFYEPFVKSVLRDYGVPTDLYHLAMIESGFNPVARSHAGAVGMWQFMPATGRSEGLRVDDLVDERMDPVRSTRAAAKHLRSLYGIFGDWALAAAAYNAGSGRVSRGMRAVSATNFWELAQRGDLAEETKQYVPRLFAVTVIGRRPDTYGFARPAVAEGFVFDSVFIDYATPLGEIARLGDTSLDRLRELNPHLRRGETPGGGYWVWVPAGGGPPLQRSYLASEFRRNGGLAAYTIRAGDTLGRIATDSDVRMSRLREMNPGIDPDLLRVGQSLRLPQTALAKLSAAAAERAASRLAAAELTAADSPLGEPEPEYATSGEPEVDGAASVAAADEPSREAGQAADDSTVGTAASVIAVAAEKAAAPAGAAAGASGTHLVRDGETLWSLSMQYGVEVEALRAANDLASDVIMPGQRLRIVREAAEHVVGSGETLWTLARRYDTTVQAIQQANGLAGGSIRPGQKLSIPR